MLFLKAVTTVCFPFANLKMLWLPWFLFISVAKEQEGWKITYLAERLCGFCLEFTGTKGQHCPPTYCSEVDIKP